MQYYKNKIINRIFTDYYKDKEMPVQLETQQQQPNSDQSVLGAIGTGALNAVTGGLGGIVTQGLGALANKIFGNTQADKDKEQLAQQQRLQQQQIAGEEQLADYQQTKQQQMYDYTSYPHQIELQKAAGLNPALIYGGGGAGGATVGGGIPSVQTSTAADTAAQTQANVASSMQLESMKVMDSQANLNNAQAAKIAGVDTQSAQQDVDTKTFNNSILHAFGMDNAQYENTIKGVESEKANTQWEAFKTAASGGKKGEDGLPIMEASDENNPYVQALKAGMDQAKQDLTNAKQTNDLTKAKTTVEQFKARLADNGIDPDSPWYVNIISDLLQNFNINPLKTVNKVKSTINNMGDKPSRSK